MPTYNVHLYPVVRIMIPNIEATSMEEAVKKATELFYPVKDTEFGIHHQFGELDFADDIVGYLVDIQGDEDYAESKWFNDATHLKNLAIRPNVKTIEV